MMILHLKTNDNHRVRVNANELRVSNLIQVLVQSMEEEEEEIPLYNVSHNVLLKVLEFARHYHQEPMKTIPLPLRDHTLPIQEWYVEFVSVLQNETLYEILHAATYMDIEPLQNLICARIACLIKGKECHEVKQIFGFEYET